MSKRLFQVLDEMNVLDTEDKSDRVGVCNVVESINYNHKKGTTVAIGVPGNVVSDITTGKRIPILLMIDAKEYERLKDQP